jgi:hypothetical protein
MHSTGVDKQRQTHVLVVCPRGSGGLAQWLCEKLEAIHMSCKDEETKGRLWKWDKNNGCTANEL